MPRARDTNSSVKMSAPSKSATAPSKSATAQSAASSRRKSRAPAASRPTDDLLDASGARPNPFNGLPLDKTLHAELARKTGWPSFRMYTEGAAKLFESLDANDVTVLSSGTGSGKTVIAPKVAHAWARIRSSALGAPGSAPRVAAGAVAVTNPKRMTTLKNAEFSAKLAQVDLGAEIGYHFRGARRESASPQTQIEYVTDGWLLQRTREDKEMTKYSVVLVDEVHERPVPTDFLLLAARNAMVARNKPGSRGAGSRGAGSRGSSAGKADSAGNSASAGNSGPLRLVVMSATLDSGVFADYYRAAGLRVGVVEVGASPNFPIARVHRPLPRGKEGDYLAEAVRHVVDIHADPKSEPGAVLVFVPVKKDARKGCKLLARACKAKGLGEDCVAVFDGTERAEYLDGQMSLGCVPLFSNAGEDAENRAQRAPPKGTRNVVFATNVAESSLTIESLDYVVDTGRAFVVRHDPSDGSFVSGKEWVTRAQALQRLGRVGRERPGTAVLMYPASFLDGPPLPDGSPPDADGMRERPEPTVSVEDITDHLFQMAASSPGGSWGLVEKEVAKLITPPSAGQIECARRNLLLLGCIDAARSTGSRSTGLAVGPVGRRVAELSKTFRVSYDVAVLLMVGARFGAAEEVALLAAVAEETRGELNALWRTFFTQDGGAVQRPPKSFQAEAAARGSQHAALVSLHKSLSAGPEELRTKLSAEVDLRVWEAVGRFAKRVGPKLAKHSPEGRGALDKLWPFSAFLPSAEISAEGLGAWAAVLAYSLPRCLTLARGGLEGSLAHAGGAAGEGKASRKFAVPDDVSGKATQGDVAACSRLSVSHGGAGGKTMPPQAEFATVYRAAARSSESFSALLSARASI